MPMQMPTTSPVVRKRFDELAETLAPTGVSRGSMFGMPCLKASNKAFAGLWGDSCVFKLGGDHHGEALALKGAELFDPSGMGRPMKEWIVVPSTHAKRWEAFAEAARTYSTGGKT